MSDDTAQQFRELADFAPVMIWRSGLDKGCTFFNKPWLDFRGRPLERELGEGWIEGVHPDDYERCRTTYTDAFDAREDYALDYRLRRHDGAYRWILTCGKPFYRADGSFRGYFGSCVDITDRKIAEERADAALAESRRMLAERDTLLAEVHHRVRNNLQVTLSLIGLHRRAFPDARAPLDSLAGRMRALAAVQQHLHEAPSVAAIDVRDYLQRLAASLGALRAPGQGGIAVRGDGFAATAKEASALGMILAEVNASGRGAMTVTIAEGPPRQVRLRADTLEDGAGGFGPRLVQAYASQAGLEIGRGDGPGGDLTLTFPARAEGPIGPGDPDRLAALDPTEGGDNAQPLWTAVPRLPAA